MAVPSTRLSPLPVAGTPQLGSTCLSNQGPCLIPLSLGSPANWRLELKSESIQTALARIQQKGSPGPPTATHQGTQRTWCSAMSNTKVDPWNRLMTAPSSHTDPERRLCGFALSSSERLLLHPCDDLDARTLIA